ncbi:Ras GTPase-activating protein 1 [Cladochytrium tenue]|nr:Ras GTPase-activating protein 1 [Cladochytrium tenue]
MADYIYLEKLRAISVDAMIDELSTCANSIDIAADMDEYFEQHSVTAKDAIPLIESSISLVDSSLLNCPNCFQIVLFDSNTGRQFYYLAAETTAERDEWFQRIRELCYCCAKCAFELSYSPDSELNEALRDSEASRVMRSLDVTISEAKDLPAGSKPGYYCVLFLDDVKHARTSTKPGVSPFWGENYAFSPGSDIRLHYTEIRVAVFSYQQIHRDICLGSVTLNLDSLKNHSKHEEWHPIKHQTRLGMEPQIVGSMRISLLMANDLVLPCSSYDPLIDLLCEPPFLLLQRLGTMTSQRDILARTALCVLASRGAEIDAIKTLAGREILSTGDSNILFRGNSLATKMFDRFMRSMGSDYLTRTVAAPIKAICTSGASFEVDPTRVGSPEALRRNWDLLLSHVRAVLDAIFDSVEGCPLGFSAIFRHLQSVVQQRSSVVGDADGPHASDSRYSVVSGFLFLRFFCPAVLSPNLFGIVADYPAPGAARNLTLVAKIIQNLANLADFGNKEQFMKECNPFIAEQTPRMKAFIDHISTRAPPTLKADWTIPVDNVRKDAQAIVDIISKHLDELVATDDANEHASFLAIVNSLHSEIEAAERARAERAQDGHQLGYPAFQSNNMLFSHLSPPRPQPSGGEVDRERRGSSGSTPLGQSPLNDDGTSPDGAFDEAFGKEAPDSDTSVPEIRVSPLGGASRARLADSPILPANVPLPSGGSSSSLSSSPQSSSLLSRMRTIQSELHGSGPPAPSAHRPSNSLGVFSVRPQTSGGSPPLFHSTSESNLLSGGSVGPSFRLRIPPRQTSGGWERSSSNSSLASVSSSSGAPPGVVVAQGLGHSWPGIVGGGANYGVDGGGSNSGRPQQKPSIFRTLAPPYPHPLLPTRSPSPAHPLSQAATTTAIVTVSAAPSSSMSVAAAVHSAGSSPQGSLLSATSMPDLSLTDLRDVRFESPEQDSPLAPVAANHHPHVTQADDAASVRSSDTASVRSDGSGRRAERLARAAVHHLQRLHHSQLQLGRYSPHSQPSSQQPQPDSPSISAPLEAPRPSPPSSTTPPGTGAVAATVGPPSPRLTAALPGGVPPTLAPAPGLSRRMSGIAGRVKNRFSQLLLAFDAERRSS